MKTLNGGGGWQYVTLINYNLFFGMWSNRYKALIKISLLDPTWHGINIIDQIAEAEWQKLNGNDQNDNGDDKMSRRRDHFVEAIMETLFNLL